MSKREKCARTAKGRSRRNFLKGSAALGAAIAAPAILKTSPRQARAEETTIRIIGPNVVALDRLVCLYCGDPDHHRMEGDRQRSRVCS